jgi:hypothetical protein
VLTILVDERVLMQLYEVNKGTGDFLEEAMAHFEDRTERSIRVKYKKLGVVIGDGRSWKPEVCPGD